ncbi:unnamed protein product [Peronospora destructor]|uniref:Elicitin-like protein n=2 Tax=Peronospora destructor TaxID=86335 RepID=A0AAV0V630_9STRA|nr:unnamed protein product [Peronospora destructor]
MQTFTSVLLVATIASGASAQSTSSMSSASETSAMPAELAAIVDCSTTQLDEAQMILTSNQRQEQCETTLHLESNTMLQVNTATATKMCDTASCKASLQELYNALPNCRYDLWGLQYSAKKLLEYCGITPTNTTGLGSGSRSVGWSVDTGSTSFAPAGVGDTFSTEGTGIAASLAPATPSESSAKTTMTTVSAALVTTAGVVAALLV